MSRPQTASLRALLVGGDRRSIAQAQRALERVRRNPKDVAALALLVGDRDPLVVMRALDVFEKLARENLETVAPYKAVLLGPIADSDRWEIRLQIVRALPLFAWSRAERPRVQAILLRDADHRQAFVRAWAVDGLAALSRNRSPPSGRL